MTRGCSFFRLTVLMRAIFALCSLICLFLVSEKGAFSQGDEVISPTEWSGKYLAASEAKEPHSGIIMRTVVVSELTPTSVKFVSINSDEFNKLGFLQTASQAINEFPLRINEKPGEKTNNCLKDRKTFILCLGVDSLIELKDKSLSIYTPKHEDANAPLIEANLKGTKKLELDIQLTVSNAVGYDAIVLEKRGDRLLVGLTSDHALPKMQGLLAQNSATRLVLPKDLKVIGTGVVALESREGAFAVMKILVTTLKDDMVRHGTKVVLESKPAVSVKE
jgi:hypothetical protein